MSEQYVKAKISYQGNCIYIVKEHIIGLHYIVEPLLLPGSTIKIFESECTPLTENETAQVLLLIESINRREAQISRIQEIIKYRKEGLNKIGCIETTTYLIG